MSDTKLQQFSDKEGSKWEEKTFSDVIEINNYPSAEKGEEYSYVGMKHLERNQRAIETVKAKEYTYSQPRFQNGDTLFARITPCLENGKTAFVDALDEGDIAFGSTEFVVLSATEEVLPKFVYYTVRRPEIRNFAIKHMTGTSGRQRVPLDVFDEKKIKVPPLEEQRKIVNFLDGLDSKIEENRRIEQKLDSIALRIFQEWFKDKEHSEKARLGAEVDTYRGYSYESDYLAEDETSGYPMINLNNIKEGGGFDIEGTKFYSQEEMKERYEVDVGDVVVSITEQTLDGELIGSPIRISPVFDQERKIISQDVCKISPKEDSILTKEFLYYLFKDNEFRNYCEQHSTGTTVYHLKTDDIEDFKLGIPSREMLEEFTRLVKDFWQLRFKLKSENEKLKDMRDLALPKLMSGEIRVNADGDE